MAINIIIIPDSFKGSASSAELCCWISGAFKKNLPGCITRCIPIADGGEGTVDCFIKAVSEDPAVTVSKVSKSVCGRLPGETVSAKFAVISDGEKKHAVIETASCSGLANGYSPLYTTTYGIGEQIRAAIQKGCTHITVGLGGSCTNDGGAGLAAALGVRFINNRGQEFLPVGATLCEIDDIDVLPALELLGTISLSAICDVDNPTVGSNGAAFVFAPQKGAKNCELSFLDDGLRKMCGVIYRKLGIDAAGLHGGGAAGGMGAGLCSLLGASLRPGIEELLDISGFDSAAVSADLVITGEGRLDAQSLGGKTVIGVARRCRAAGVPLIVLAGGVELDSKSLEAVYAEGVTSVFSINRSGEPFDTARLRVRENVFLTAGDLARLIAAGLKTK